MLGEFNGRKALKPQGAMVYVTETASDANYTANETAFYIILPSITANRTLTIPSASSNLGRQIKIFNKNNSVNLWSFNSAIKTPSGTSVTNITNESCLYLFSDGTNWINVLAADNGSMKGVQSKSISLQSPTSSENISMWYTTEAITIEEVRGVMLGSSQSVTLTLNYGSSRASASGTIVASNTFDSGDSGYQTTGFTFTLNTTTIPAGSYIWLTTSAASGTINELNISVTYK